MIDAVASGIASAADELTKLDQAIGDGDHGLNMKRGFDEVASKADEIAAKSWGQGLTQAGMSLVMKVGGASGPLYGSLLMEMGKALGDGEPDRASFAEAFAAGIEKVKARGKSDVGQKTLLDVLMPVSHALNAGVELKGIKSVAERSAEATVPMQAIKGRASFLGERSIGHMDPGARSSSLIIAVVCDVLEASHE